MNTFFRVLTAVMMLSASVGYAADAPAAAPAAAEAPKKTISVDFRDMPLSTVLDVMSLKTGMKLITDDELARKRVVFSLRDVSPEEALTALLDTYNLYYVRQPNTSIYVIKSKSDNSNIKPTLVSKIIYLNYSKAEEIATVLKSNLTLNGQMSVDARSNSIVVTDIADSVDKIEATVRGLDSPTLQAVLEMRIVDSAITDEISWGVDISQLYKTGSYYPFPDPLLVHPVPSASDVRIPSVNYGQTYRQQDAGNALAFSLQQEGYTLKGAISAEKGLSDSKVLSNPRLMVINNKEAKIDIIDEYPYVSEVTVVGGALVRTISFKEAGIRLHVLPQINRDGSIVLTVSPEQSFRSALAADNQPIISTTKASTVLMLRNGETAVIGGLIREIDLVNEVKVPFLGDIPILGYLFKKFDKSKERRELTIFITAKIVD